MLLLLLLQLFLPPDLGGNELLGSAGFQGATTDIIFSSSATFAAASATWPAAQCPGGRSGARTGGSLRWKSSVLCSAEKRVCACSPP